MPVCAVKGAQNGGKNVKFNNLLNYLPHYHDQLYLKQNPHGADCIAEYAGLCPDRMLRS